MDYLHLPQIKLLSGTEELSDLISGNYFQIIPELDSFEPVNSVSSVEDARQLDIHTYVAIYRNRRSKVAR